MNIILLQKVYYLCHRKEYEANRSGCQDSDNYCATLEWIRQQVRVRFPDIGIGIAGIKIELTKERAWILRDMIKIMEDYVPEGDHTQSVILEWLNQSINRLYSEFDLGMI